MGRTIGRFDFIQVPSEGNHSPIIKISLRTWFKRQTEPHKGTITISPDLMTEGEIDDCVDQLKDDLDAVRAKAKKKLAADRLG
jgi:hypothetical protein